MTSTHVSKAGGDLRVLHVLPVEHGGDELLDGGAWWALLQTVLLEQLEAARLRLRHAHSHADVTQAGSERWAGLRRCQGAWFTHSSHRVLPGEYRTLLELN